MLDTNKGVFSCLSYDDRRELSELDQTYHHCGWFNDAVFGYKVYILNSNKKDIMSPKVWFNKHYGNMMDIPTLPELDEAAPAVMLSDKMVQELKDLRPVQPSDPFAEKLAWETELEDEDVQLSLDEIEFDPEPDVCHSCELPQSQE